jgi:hypothetical protein
MREILTETVEAGLTFFHPRYLLLNIGIETFNLKLNDSFAE